MILFYWIFRVFTFIVSRLPMPVLYSLASLLRIILHHGIRYRRKIILDNLQQSFPQKKPAEIKAIMKDYYMHLSQIILEIICLEHISQNQLLQRFKFNGLEILENAFRQGKNVIVTIGHCGNWEWMGTVLGLHSSVKGYAIIKPLSEKRFHQYMTGLRHRLNPNSTIDFQHTYRNLVRNRREGQAFYVFAADQTPTRSDINYWSIFLGRETPFYNGVEKLARSLDFHIVFMDIYRTGKGHYQGDITLITNDPMNTPENEITEKYIHLLEASIVKRPDNWLWSHRRWKFSRTHH